MTRRKSKMKMPLIKDLLKSKYWRLTISSSVVILLLGLPLVIYYLTNFIKPAQSWFDNAWEFRKPVQISYTGSTKTNYDLLVTLDTASLISSGKIQNDCDDIRFLDNDDVTQLTYWIEGGCNSADTQIWVRVPSVPNGGKTIYMYYGNGSATSSSEVWSGETTLFSGSSCPSGWVINTDLDGKFAYGGATYGATGGSANHSHSNISVNVDTSGASLLYGFSGVNNAGSSAHTHSISATVSSVSNLPPYLSFVPCKKSSFDIPSGLISISPTSTPSGWTREITLDSKFLMGATVAGTSGGATTHSHTVGAVVSGTVSGTSGVAIYEEGNGADGAVTISAHKNISTDTIATGRTCADGISYSVTGLTSNSATLSATPAAGCLAVGDEVLLINMQGTSSNTTNVGNYEFLRIQNVSTNTITFSSNKVNSYGDSGDTNIGTSTTNQRVVLQRVPNYSSMSISSGYQLTANAWDGTKGGIVVFRVSGTLTLGSGSYVSALGLGYRGGSAGGVGTVGQQGESYAGVGSNSLSANRGGGSGGGCGDASNGNGGSGGGYGATGSIPTTSCANTGGASYGNTSFTKLFLGSGGGGGGIVAVGSQAGGSGGGIVYIGASSISSSGVIRAIGSGGSSSGSQAAGGGGSGGSILFKVGTLTSTGTISSAGGSGGSSGSTQNVGAAGAVGRVTAMYITSVSGSATPTMTTTQITGLSSVSTSHTHTFSGGSTSTVSNLPPYLDVLYNSANSSTYMPVNSIAIVNTLPPLGWSRYTALDNKFARGNSVGGGSGGSASHTHSGVAYSTSAASGSAVNINTGGSIGVFGTAHTHSFTPTTDSVSLLPPYIQVIFAQKKDNSVDGVSFSLGSEQSNVPLTPSISDAVATSSTSIEWHFIDNASNETGIKVFDSLGNLMTTCVGVNLTACEETGLLPNTQYIRKYKAYNANGDSTNFSDTYAKYTLNTVPTISISNPTTSSLDLTVSGVSNIAQGDSGVYLDCLGAECDTNINYWQQELTATVTGLNSNTQYSFTVKAKNGEEVETATSESVSKYTLADVPSISFSELSSTSVRLNATGLNNMGVGSSAVYYECLSDGCVSSGSWQSTGSEVISNLLPNTNYSFRVKARNAQGVETSYSSSFSVTTLSNTPNALGISQITTDSLRLTLSPVLNSNPESTLYAIYEESTGKYVAPASNLLENSPVWETYADFGSSSGILLNSLQEGHVYTFKVKAKNIDNVETEYSLATSAATSLNTPNSLSAQVLSDTSIKWNFTDTSGNESGFRIYDQDENVKAECVGANLTSCTETGLAPNTTYTRYVSVYNDVTVSGFSNSATGNTFAHIPDAPSVTFGENSAVVDVAPSSNPSSVVYAIYEVNTGKYVSETGSLVTSEVWNSDDGWGSKSVSGLSPNTNYSFKVKARNSSSVETAFSTATSGYTLAASIPAPTITGASNSIVNVKINVGDNPTSTTTFAIFSEDNGKYIDPSTGNMQSDFISGSYASWGGDSGKNIGGLSVNTGYSFKAKAVNHDGIEGAFSDVALGYTLANIPSAPTVSASSSTILSVLLNINSNPTNTEYAVQINGSSYINFSSGNVQLSENWGTYSQWGGAVGKGVVSLAPDTLYSVRVKARNGSGVETIFGNSVNTYTLANIPGTPQVQSVSNSSAKLIINRNGNPLSVEYVIEEVNSGKFVNSSGSLVASEVWGTYSDFGSSSGVVVTGLVPGNTYEFRVKAKNSAGQETSYSSLSSSYSSLPAPVIGTPQVIDATTIRWAFSESLNGESGFRVFDENGVQVAQCVGENLTYCDEFGLTPNTSYSRKIAGYNGNGDGEFSEIANAVTFATVPSAPTVTATSSTVLNLKFSLGANPSNTQFAIVETVSGNYLDYSSGLLINDVVWGTRAQFGGENGINITNLFANAGYTFAIKARNISNVETSLSFATNVYTLAGPIGNPSVEGASDTTVKVVIDNGGNSYLTSFSILEVNSGKYVRLGGGDLTSSAVWGRYDQFGSQNGVIVTGLTSNTQYVFRVTVNNSQGITSDVSDDVSTYTKAGRPSALGVSVVGTTTMRVTLNAGNSISNLFYAIWVSEINKFVSLNGSLVDSPVWASYSAWGGSSGTLVSDLVPGKGYTFLIKTKNTLNEDTAYSDGRANYTFTLVPGKPNMNIESTTGGRVFITNPGNDASTLYAVVDTVSNKYLSYEDGTLKSSAVWGTYDQWGGDAGFLAKGLPSAADFTFRVKSKNLGGRESGWSASLSVSTNAIITNAPVNTKISLKDFSDVEVTKFEGAQRGEKLLRIMYNNEVVADVPVSFDSDKDWSSVLVNGIAGESKSLVKLGTANGLKGTFTLYTPVNSTTRLRVCPSTISIETLKPTCANSVLFTGSYPQVKIVEGGEVIVGKTEINGKMYWYAQGLKGTGIIGEIEDTGSAPTTNPDTEGNNGNSGGDSSGGSSDTPKVVLPTENVVKAISNPVVKNVAKTVLVDVPTQTVVVAQVIGETIDNTPVGKLDEPSLTTVSSTTSAVALTFSLAIFAGGFTNIPYLFVQLFIATISFFGFRKTNKPYGLVYDSVTKKPINRAIVRIYNTQDRLVWTDVTDAFGSFKVDVKPGKYKILVIKSGYTYPSKIITGPIDYPLEPVYHGEVVEFNKKTSFSLVIPIDLNDTSARAATWAKIENRLSIVVKLVNLLIFFIGLVLGLYTYFKYPSTVNVMALCAYLPALFILIKNIFVKSESFGRVTDKNGKPIAGVNISLKEMKFDKYVGKRVSDESGLYQFVMPNDTYKLEVLDEVYRAVRYEGGSSLVAKKRNAKVNVIDKDIIVRKK